jgi:cyclopropane-fatty-acyl-phospholipid synthase
VRARRARLAADALVRLGIRRHLRAHLAAERARGESARLADELRKGPIAPELETANLQHYELPPDFFRTVLGPRRKYSAALFASQGESLGSAEERMLWKTCERAELEDGMRVLDLGSGWGPFALFVAEHFPRCEVVALSSGKAQAEEILAACARGGLGRIEVHAADVDRFAPVGRFDRVVSVETFEHARNWELLLARIASWLYDDGKLFVHVFRHEKVAYRLEPEAGGWLARHLPSGGIMPAQSLLHAFERELAIEAEWSLSGTHYARTAEAWLANLDRNRERARESLVPVYGVRGAGRALQRWRLFFIACAELFAFRGGSEWGVGHYRLARRRS